MGGLVLVCLALFTALIFEAGSTSDIPELQLDVADGDVSDAAAFGDQRASDATAASNARDRSANVAAYDAEPSPLQAGVITALEQAAEEPIEVELAHLLDAIQQGFGESSVQIAPALRPYAYRIAGRMNIRPGAFRVRVAAPSEALAVARAEVLARLFEAAGVVSSRLTFVPRTGIHSLAADPA